LERGKEGEKKRGDEDLQKAEELISRESRKGSEACREMQRNLAHNNINKAFREEKTSQKLGFWIIRVLGCVLKMLKTVANKNLETGKLGI
jgi:hypothetical protein